MKKMLLSAFVALTFGVSTFANQIAKDENFEFEEELVVDCYAVAEALLQRDMQNNPEADWNQRNQSNTFNAHYDNCVSTGLCTTCGKPVVVGLVP
jgi:hypothetical protein